MILDMMIMQNHTRRPFPLILDMVIVHDKTKYITVLYFCVLWMLEI